MDEWQLHDEYVETFGHQRLPGLALAKSVSCAQKRCHVVLQQECTLETLWLSPQIWFRFCWGCST
eukprot:2565478-Amphidinium_carterae.2